MVCASQMMASHNFKICYSGNKTCYNPTGRIWHSGVLHHPGGPCLRTLGEYPIWSLKSVRYQPTQDHHNSISLLARQAVCPSPPQTDETVTTDLSRTISLVHDQVRRSRITIQLWKQVSLHDTSPPTLKRYPSMCQEQTSFCAANIKHYLCISAKVSESD